MSTDKATGPEYFAVPDPADPARMTYWRQQNGIRKPWPPKARYGPQLIRAEVPTDRYERHGFLLQWFDQVGTPWRLAVVAAIDADPAGCAARFAAFTTRCCQCGRRLKDPASKTYGIGPECRTGWPDSELAMLAEAVGRAHAELAASISAA